MTGEQVGAAVPDVPGQNPAGHFDPGHGGFVKNLQLCYLYIPRVHGILLWICIFVGELRTL